MHEDRRFIIGIDLGTTNCAVSYFDTTEKNPTCKIFRIPQLNAQKMVEALPMLPSFHYLAEEGELEGCLLPWQKVSKNFAIGAYAEKHGMKVPTRLISSAKSWLSNRWLDRKEKILPFDAVDSSRKLSPLEASASYLEHIRQAWNTQFASKNPGLELEQQEVVITVPASFDEIARSLTIESAKKAGISQFTLLEEPQAAFYNWLMEHGHEASSLFQKGDLILVCDVGGGTSDFSLIQVTSLSPKLEFQRSQVGPHLLLGGDNMDLAICHYIEKQSGGEFDPAQWLSLRFSAKSAKEFLLGKEGNETFSIWIGGKGSKVVGGGLGIQLKKDEIEKLLARGFFGLYDFAEATLLEKGDGLRSMGLDYEPDPSITKHLAHFLLKSRATCKPQYVLFNGGAMKPLLFQQRIMQSLDRWFPEYAPARFLQSSSLDLAVSKGAAYFAKSRREGGLRIGGGLARSYYLKIDAAGSAGPQAITLCERGEREGMERTLATRFALKANSAVSFQLLHSHTRLNDNFEEIVEINEEEMSNLPPLVTILRYGKEKEALIPVRLFLKWTELGVLELALHSETTEHVWKLEFQLGAYQTEDCLQDRLIDEVMEDRLLEDAKKELKEAFAIGQQAKLKAIVSSIESILQKQKNEWPPSVLRALFAELMQASEKRNLAPAFETRFWNLAGFFLRPGSGFPLDDFRVKELWKLILADLKSAKPEEVEIQKWITYRRISAGLKKGQQAQLFNELFPSIYQPKQKKLYVNEKKGRYAFEEKLRACASFELVDTTAKQKLGDAILEKILSGKAHSAEYWSLARIGARQLLYGSISNVIPKNICEQWIEQLIMKPIAESEHLPFLLFLLAQKTDFREINVSQKHQMLVENYLADKKVDVQEFSSSSIKQMERMFGDSLPQGLKILS